MTSRDILILGYLFGLPAIWALIVGFDIARRLKPGRFAQLKAAGEFVLGVLIVPVLQVVLVVLSTKMIEAGGRRVSGEAAIRLVSAVSLPLALVFFWGLLATLFFTLLVHLKMQRRPFGRRASDLRAPA